MWFNASGFTHINCLKGWNRIWNENSRMKNSDCWTGLNFSATERKLYGLIFTTLSWFNTTKQKKNLWRLLVHTKWVLTGINSFSKELLPWQSTDSCSVWQGGAQQHSSQLEIFPALRFESDFSLPSPENLNWNVLRLYTDNPISTCNLCKLLMKIIYCDFISSWLWKWMQFFFHLFGRAAGGEVGT